MRAGQTSLEEGPRPARGAALFVAAAVAGLSAALAPAGLHGQADDPFLADVRRDPLELARLVRREGDGAVLERLVGEVSPDGRMAAIAAAPEMVAPEAALAPLAELAASRDPDVAPAAAAALLRIGRALDAAALARREVFPADLQPSAEALRRLEADATARPDIRSAARTCAAHIDGLSSANAPTSPAAP